ncbi:PE family protein [Mycobacterium paragordonae]|nr:PE family protein [Mycobacterium paragordonae]
MSFVIAAPQDMTAAATHLASIGSTVSSARAGAAASTTAIVAAGYGLRCQHVSGGLIGREPAAADVGAKLRNCRA